MVIEDEIVRFKMQLLRKMPFYGDIVMRLPIVRNDAVPTAQTNGRMIEYNAKFLSGMREGQRNFVIMHEIFHVLLFHCDRRNERRPRIWNTAADIIVNHMLQRLTHEMNSRGIVFERPVDGIFEYINDSETVENLYAKLLEANKDQRENSKKVRVMLNNWGPYRNKQFNAPDDIILIDVTEHSGDVKKGKDDEDSKDLLKEIGLSKQAILDIIRESATKNRSSMGSYFVPKQLFGLVESKKIKWQVLLKDFLIEEINEETSYSTPERKYIHMDLIIPGYGTQEEKLEEIWAFVDSSGSIGSNEMSQFLTQLYRISKEFHCVINICYWDTEVTDIYKKIANEKDIFNSLPKHSGGTDINCVYRWIKENKVKPDVMLVLTDGFFGELSQQYYNRTLSQKTILVLSGNIQVTESMKHIGKIARL
jgi:predicted metal-dependent peptidase